ncbi:DUF29 family protein [Sulfurihydrogenibium sp.]|uniref:DUF29 family protein n=1 Tax=Sulfurihydrogenibium sp. TaxID=2053621 RepID=UPI002631D54C|nr:DUF29 family protein [Sulfurihydrogenibium sp.]
MSKRDERSLISYLAIILAHLYKWDNYTGIASHKTKGGKNWINSIVNARKEIEDLVSDMPSLERFIESFETIQKAWEEALKIIRKDLLKNGIKNVNLPNSCPYDIIDILYRDVIYEYKKKYNL